MFAHRLISRAGVTGRVAVVALGVAGASLAGGCASQKATAVNETPPMFLTLQAEANIALGQAVTAARDGDFQTLRVKATEALDLAQTERQQRQARSLLHLADGFDALSAGDFKAAGLAWGQITDPALREEVMQQADRIGVDVPAVSLATLNSKVNH